MQNMKSKLRRSLELVSIVLAAMGAIFFGPAVLGKLGLDPEPVSAMASVVAAVVGAIAARAAFRAAQESSFSARDSARAVALAQKPIIRMTMKPHEENSTGLMKVDLENLSQQPVRNGLLRWALRDGTSGFMEIPVISARTHPFGGMIHDPEREASYTLGTFDDSLEGTDRVSFEYSGPSNVIRWQLNQEEIYRKDDGGTLHMRHDEWMPIPQLKDRTQYEHEA